MSDNADIQVTRLPNGLTVVTESMDRVETVSFGAYVASGTRNETKPENGASHFLEHMAFKGTKARPRSAGLLRHTDSTHSFASHRLDA